MRIHYFTPFDTNKNIGYAHNEAVKSVQDPEDWICLRDADTMFLLPDFGNTIEEAINTHGKDYKLFGCLTNRLGVSHQLYKNNFSDNSDMSEHIKIAKECVNNNNVIDCDLVAGMFMLFQKKTWLEVGGFETSIYFDKLFSQKIIKHGGRLGILQSIYIFHLYRWGQKNAPYKYQHLLK